MFTGLYAILIWLYENLKSPLQVIYHSIKPYFVPKEKKSLVEKYGDWAGKWTLNIFYLNLIVFLFLLMVNFVFFFVFLISF